MFLYLCFVKRAFYRYFRTGLFNLVLFTSRLTILKKLLIAERDSIQSLRVLSFVLFFHELTPSVFLFFKDFF